MTLRDVDNLKPIVYLRHILKVFIISLPKTGTTSVCSALEILNFSSIHYPKTFAEIEQYDSAGDSFVAINYKELDRLYPDAKFIYVKRQLDDWLASLERHMAKLPVPNQGTTAYQFRVDAVGSATFEYDINKAHFIRHENDVTDYFRERPDDLLILDLSAEDKWSALATFLNRDIPDVAFPLLNVKSSAYSGNASD